MPTLWVFFVLVQINQDLCYDESLSGQPGTWLVKKIFFICLQSQNFFKKYLILKFKMISRTSFVFMIAFMIYKYIDVHYGGTYPEKNRNNLQSFQVKTMNPH